MNATNPLLYMPGLPAFDRIEPAHVKPAVDQLLAAVEIEANGFLRVESEEAGRDLLTPKRGGTAARLTKIARQITKHLS